MQVPRQAQGTGQLCTWIAVADAGQWHVWVITTWIASHLGSVAYSPYTSSARASRVTEVLNGGKAIKKRQSLAEGSLTAQSSRPLTAFLSIDILFWWCHFLLIRFALVISESWQPFLLTVVESWDLFSVCHRCLLKLMAFQLLSVDVSFSWHPYILASLFLGTLPFFFPESPNLVICFWHGFTVIENTLNMIFFWQHDLLVDWWTT